MKSEIKIVREPRASMDEDDQESLWQLYIQCFSPHQSDALSSAGLKELLSSKGVKLLTARSCNMLIGFLIWREASSEAEILSIGVDPMFRKARIAHTLIGELIKLSRDNIEEIYLEVSEKNSAAIALYKASGFCQVGTRKNYYRAADGNVCDGLILKCLLSNNAD